MDRIFEVLSGFTKHEIKELGYFLKMPSVNGGRDCSKYYDIVIRYYPCFNGKECNRKSIFSELYPGKQFKDHIIRNLASGLLKISEEYLAFRNLKRSNAAVNRHIIAELIERNAVHAAAIKIKKQDTLLSNSETDIENLYTEKYYLQNLNIINNINSGNPELISSSIKKSTELIIFDFIQSVSVVFINLLNYKDNYNIDYSGNLIEKFLKHFDIKKFINDPENTYTIQENPDKLKIYSCIIITLSEPGDEKYYFLLKKLLLKNLNKFGRTEKYNLMVAFSSCTSMKAAVLDRTKYLEELFEIYRIRYAGKLYSYSDNQPMSVIFYFSALRLSLALKQYNWAEEFAIKGSDLLPEIHKENMKNFSYALLLFVKNRFREALGYLSKVQIKDFSFNYEFRTLQLQIYFELNEYETAVYNVDAYKHFLNTNKSVSQYLRYSSEEFLSIYENLLRLKNFRKNMDVKDIGEKIKICKLPQKEWLMNKYEELTAKTAKVR